MKGWNKPLCTRKDDMKFILKDIHWALVRLIPTSGLLEGICTLHQKGKYPVIWRTCRPLFSSILGIASLILLGCHYHLSPKVQYRFQTFLMSRCPANVHENLRRIFLHNSNSVFTALSGSKSGSGRRRHVCI